VLLGPDSTSPRRRTVSDRRSDIAAVPDVSIIVVSYNSEAYLERSVGAVVGGPYEVIVVDNASTDRSPDLVRGRFPSARLLELETNVGFGAANNEGMRVASGRYFLLMNPDAWPKGDAIEELVRFADARAGLGVAGPLLRAPDGRTQQSAFGYPTRLWLGAPAVTSLSQRSSAPARAVEALGRAVARRRRTGGIFLVGTALLLRREAVCEVGGFDPRFFMFNEEIDLCWRLRQAGWRVELCPTAEFVHVGGASTRTAWSKMYREQLDTRPPALPREAPRNRDRRASASSPGADGSAAWAFDGWRRTRRVSRSGRVAGVGPSEGSCVAS
jgi:GT2 family glycosyltransferase